MFHIAQRMNGAVDQVRQRARLLQARATDSIRLVAAGRKESPPTSRSGPLAELTAAARRRLPEDGAAVGLEESLRNLWRCRSRLAAREAVALVVPVAARQAAQADALEVAPPDRQAASAQRPHLLPAPDHNAMSEGIASKIQALKKGANGFRDRDDFKTAICFAAVALICTNFYRPRARCDLRMRREKGLSLETCGRASMVRHTEVGE